MLNLPLFLYHFLALAVTSFSPKRYPQNIEMIVCMTIDGDEKEKGDIVIAVPWLLTFFNRMHLKGKVTWFLNEHDVNWVEKYSDIVIKLLERGDEIGLHSHIEGIIHNYQSLVLTILNAKQKIEKFCAKYLSNGYSITSFRSGKLAKSKELFKAIFDVGFMFDSSIRPGWSRNEVDTDDRSIPPLVNPFYVDLNDYKVPSLSLKTVLELPVTLYPYSPLIRKDPGQKNLYVILKHPYEFLGIHGLFTRAYIQSLLFFLKRFPNIKFMTITEAGQYFIENQYRWR